MGNIKRIISLLIAAMMFANILLITSSAESTHAHMVCGEVVCAGHPDGTVHAEAINYDSALSAVNGILYIDGVEQTSSNKVYSKYTLESGNYYLAGDVDIESRISVSGNVNLCLNGYTYTSYQLECDNGGVLNICDCSENSMGTVISDKEYNEALSCNEGVIYVYDGNYDGYKAVNVKCGGSVTIFDGLFSADEFTLNAASGGSLTVYGGSYYSSGQLKDSDMGSETATIRASYSNEADTIINIIDGKFTTDSVGQPVIWVDNRNSGNKNFDINIIGGSYSHSDANGVVLNIYNNPDTPENEMLSQDILNEISTWVDSDGNLIDPTVSSMAFSFANHQKSDKIVKEIDTHWYSCKCGFCFNKLDETPHIYDQEIVDTEYWASNATCETASKYYKLCVCGAVGEETFEYGTPNRHIDWDNDGACDDCSDEMSVTVNPAMTIDVSLIFAFLQKLFDLVGGLFS